MLGEKEGLRKMEIIARMRSEFPEKFGVPRQSGLVPETTGRIVFEPAFRQADALRGIEGFSHLWLIWQFHQAQREGWSATVRPPRLGGNERMGVFATRSPFRPNAIGLSCVALREVLWDTPQGPVLLVGGADLVDGTPIFDIKPYIPAYDSHPDAACGFLDRAQERDLSVVFPEELEEKIAPERRSALRGVLAQDPRPSYQDDPSRVYGVAFGEQNVKFTVEGGVLTVRGVEKYTGKR